MAEKKLEKTHVEEINALREAFATNSSNISSTAKEIYMLHKKQDEVESFKIQLLDQYQTLLTQESALIEKLKDHYGEGQIDIENGIFISAETNK